MQVERNYNLQKIHTFGVQVYANAYAIITKEDNLCQLSALRKQYDELLILGGGSNVLFTKDFPGIAIHNQLKGIEIQEENEQDVFLKVASGEVWHDFVIHCVQNNWGGIENLSLIPGTIGAAPMQNIGAYGVEVKDVIVEVNAFDIEKQSWKTFSNEECQFGYRESIFKYPENKNKYFITSVIFKLKKAPHQYHVEYGDIQKTLSEMKVNEPSIQAISEAVIHIRNQKLPNPKDLGNAGSFFKNPEVEKKIVEGLLNSYPQMPHYLLENGKVKVPAGWLIEQCGWKGLRVGETGNHARQALVIVNYGNASGEEIRSHAMNVQMSVKEKFNIQLTPEVNFI